MAVAVASGQPCLGYFPVPRPGRVLLYAAEDAPEQMRERIENLAQARRADFTTLELGLILEPSLRLDSAEHLARLRATLQRHQPKLLVLDPYVRLQRVDENDATKVSAILAALREISRTFHLAVTLVHHTRKNSSHHTGQNLRGSSDFHAWGDSNLYLLRRRHQLLLNMEHRFAPAGSPLTLELVTDKTPVRLDVIQENRALQESSLGVRLIQALEAGDPRRQEDLRRQLRIRNQRLSDLLREFESVGWIGRSSQGWHLVRQP
jgi:hypothetical protein